MQELLATMTAREWQRIWRGLQRQRKKPDMPPRGRHRLKTGAINHGLNLPPDHVAIWRCRHGHPFFTVGPAVALPGNTNKLLVRADAAQLMTGSHGCRRVVCGVCGESYTEQVPVKKGLQLMLRAIFRLDGEEGVAFTLRLEYGYDIGRPYFQISPTDEIGCEFPASSMTQGLHNSSRFIRGGNPWG